MTTESDTYKNLPEGLSAKQYEAAMRLAAGVPILKISEEIGVHRSTIWSWKRKETFQAFYNSLLLEAKENASDAILGLHSEATETIRRILTSGSDSSALKAAVYVIEQLKGTNVGFTNPRSLIVAKIGRPPESGYGELTYDDEEYLSRCEALGIDS